MITEFIELYPPAKNGSGWCVPAGEGGYTNSFLYDDGNIYFAAIAPDECSGYYDTKAMAYLASINYYVKYGRDYPHEISGAQVQPTTVQSTTMEFE